MAQYLDYSGLSLYDRLIKILIENKETALLEAISSKVNAVIEGTNGTATIFNEADGGGARFVNKDGIESFVGVNDGGENGLAAQIYADKYVDGKWQGAKIDVTNGGIYYTVGDDSFGDRAVDGNEIAVKGDVAEVAAEVSSLRSIVADITGADSDSMSSIAELKQAIDANSEAINALIGEGEGSIGSKIDDAVSVAVAGLVGGAPEALDTLREIIEWIGGSDSPEAKDIAAELAKNSKDISDNAEAISGLDSKIDDAVEAAVRNFADQDEAIKANSEAINAQVTTIAEQGAAITQNTSDIAQNASDIAKNAEDIASANEAYESATERINALEDILGISGSESEDTSILDRVEIIETRLDAIREEEDEAIDEPDIRDLFSAEINSQVPSNEE